MGEQYELLHRKSHDSASSSHSSLYDIHETSPRKSTLLKPSLWRFVRLFSRPGRVVYTRVHRQSGSRGRLLRYLRWICTAFAIVTTVLIIFTITFRPSYARPPHHYRALQEKCQNSKEPGRGNVNDEKIFIAATLHDPEGRLLQNDWGNAVLRLVDLLGPQNVHFSLYENDASPKAEASLRSMDEKLNC